MAKRAKSVRAPESPTAEVQAEIDRRLAMQYSYEVFEEEGDWFARIVEFPGCMSDGKTPTEAIRMVRDAARGWLQVGIENGDLIPEPMGVDDYSGRFVVRIPPTLHRDLVRRAEREGVSLNMFAVAALARAIGQER